MNTLNQIVRVAGTTGGPSRLSQVWQHRELLRSMIIRNLKVKYQRSLLGFVWTLFNPLLTVAILVLSIAARLLLNRTAAR